MIRASYQHRYGIFIRLVLSTGIRLGELLGLRWEDVDFGAGMLYIRRTLNRLQKTSLPADYAGPKTEIVIQEPKTQNSIRTIPLLSVLLQELRQWQAVQAYDRQAANGKYVESGMIVTNTLGGYIEPRTFKDYYEQIMAFPLQVQLIRLVLDYDNTAEILTVKTDETLINRFKEQKSLVEIAQKYEGQYAERYKNYISIV